MSQTIDLKQPKALTLLFFAEMWERFSYYGMRALLVLFMTSELLFADSHAYGIYAAYATLIYATPILGGILADQLLGCRRAIIFGSIVIALGHFSLAFPGHKLFYLGLALIIAGTGFFKANITSLLGQFYEEHDPRRDAGFTLFYVGVNVGASFAPLACGWVGHAYGWEYGFGLAGIGMLLGALTFYLGRSALEGKGQPLNPALLKKKYAGITLEYIVYGGGLLSVLFFMGLVMEHSYMHGIMPILGVLSAGYLLYIGYRSSSDDRKLLFAMFIMMFFQTSFWAFYEQYGSSLTLFTDRNVDRMVMGFEVPTPWLQSLLGINIVIFGPLFTVIWMWLGRRNLEPTSPIKFAMGLGFLALAFYVLTTGAYFANGSGMVNILWIIGCYLLISFGELSISPVGLSMVTRLSPVGYCSAIMGIWFLTLSFANHLAGLIAKLMAITPGQDVIDATATLGVYRDVFNQISLWTVATAALLVLLTPFLKKLAFNKVG